MSINHLIIVSWESAADRICLKESILHAAHFRWRFSIDGGRFEDLNEVEARIRAHKNDVWLKVHQCQS